LYPYHNFTWLLMLSRLESPYAVAKTTIGGEGGIRTPVSTTYFSLHTIINLLLISTKALGTHIP
jgi:hypothetical protein